MARNESPLRERDERIFALVHNGEPQQDVADRFGLSRGRVSQIYNRMWKEHCDMAAFEKVRATSGLNHLVQIGREKYRGDCHLPNGKVKTKEFKLPREEATEQWLAWVEEVELDWEERHQVPDEDALVPEPEQTTTQGGPAVTTVTTSEPEPEMQVAVYAPPTYEEQRDDLFLLHRADWQGTPMLFRDLDRALATAASLEKVAGVEFDVCEVAFWEEG